MSTTLASKKVATKVWSAVSIVVGIAVVSQAQTTTSKSKRTVWVSPPTGSLLGGGYVDAGEANERKASNSMRPVDDAALRAAVAKFDVQAQTIVDGWTLAASAVALQTGVSTEVLKEQQRRTGMSYSELLIADSLARTTNKTFAEIRTQRAKSESWTYLAKHLGVSVASIAARLQAATDAMKYAQSRKNKRRDQNLRDSFNPIEHTPPSG